MADNTADQSLKIQIILDLINAGKVDEAKAGLQELKQSAGDLSTSLPKGAEGWEKYKNVLGAAGDEALSMRERMELLRLGLSNVAAETGPLGELVRLFLNPTTAGLAIAVAGIEEYFRWQEKQAEKYRQIIGLADDYNNTVTKMLDAEDHQNQQYIKRVEYAEKLVELNNTIEEQLKRQVVFVNQAKEAWNDTNTVAQAVRENTESTNDAMEKMLVGLGMVSGLQAQLHDIRQKAADDLTKQKEAMDKANADVTFKQQELDKENAAQGQLGTADSVTNALVAAQEAKKGNDAIIDQFENVTNTFKTRMGTLEGNIKPGTDLFNDAQKLMSGKMSNDDIASMDKFWQGLFQNNYSVYSEGVGLNEKTAFQAMLDMAREQNAAQGTYDKAVASAPDIDKQAIVAQANYDAFQNLNKEIQETTDQLNSLKNAASTAQQIYEDAAKTSPQKTAAEEIDARLKATGGSVDSIFAGGIAGILGLRNLLRQTGESEDEITQRGAAAETVSGRPLTAQEQRDRANYEQLKIYQDQIEASKELVTASGLSAQAVTANMQSSVSIHRTMAENMRALGAQLEAIKRKLAQHGKQISAQSTTQ